MKRFAIVLLFSIAALCHGQTDNTFYVKQFPGTTVGAKVTAAMASCNTNTAIPCILVLDPSLAVYATGTMPTLCAQCYLMDYRSGGGTIPPGLSSDGNGGIKVTGAFASGSVSIGCPTTNTIAQCVSKLPANGGTIQLNQGVYVSGYSEVTSTYLTVPNVTLMGAGLPGIGALSLVSGTGTIINGPLPFAANNFSIFNLGVDVGPNVIAANFGGTVQDGIASIATTCGIGTCLWQAPHIENVAVIGLSYGSLAHDVLFQGTNNGVVKNLHTQFNVHGLAVVGSTNLTVDGLYSTGHQQDGWIIKTGDNLTVDSTNISGKNINCSDYATTGAYGDTGYCVQIQTTNSPGYGNINGVKIDGVTCSGMKNSCIGTITAAGYNVSDVQVSKISATGDNQGDVEIQEAGSAGLTLNVEIGGGVFMNGQGDAVSVNFGSSNVKLRNLTIINDGGSGGVYNQGTNTVLDAVNYPSAPPGDRYVYNDSEGSLWALNMTPNVAAYIIMNAGTVGYPAIFNGCSYTSTVSVQAGTSCGFSPSWDSATFNIQANAPMYRPVASNTVTLTALGTPVAFLPYTISGIVIFRDNTKGGNALALIDGNGGATILSSSITGLTLAVSGTNYVVSVASGTVARTLVYGLYGAA